MRMCFAVENKLTHEIIKAFDSNAFGTMNQKLFCHATNENPNIDAKKKLSCTSPCKFRNFSRTLAWRKKRFFQENGSKAI